MTQKSPPPVSVKKDGGVMRALGDLVLLLLMLVAAGGGGYFWGIHQQLAPVLKVGAGTPGAMISEQLAAFTGNKGSKSSESSGSSSNSPAGRTVADTSSSTHHTGKRKYWICSSGTDYTGYSITAKVNGRAVDNFFGPGKTVDITGLVKPGSNSLILEAKELGTKYNKHAGDEHSALKLQVVSGPHVTEDFPSSDVILSYQRTAAENEDHTDTLQFDGE